jgi:outer membrane receptor protein involved in Fe transport
MDRFRSAIAMKYVGSFYTDNFGNEANQNDAFTVFNLELAYITPEVFDISFLIRGEVRNLFNHLYFSSGEGNSFFPAAERNYLVGISASL